MNDLDEFLTACGERGVGYVSILGGHPIRFMAYGWLEHYCQAAGKSRTPEEVGWLYDVKGPEDEKRAKANFARLIEYLRDHPDLEVIGSAEAAKMFSTQPAKITRDELIPAAEQITAAGGPVLHRTFSPAEIFCGLADSLVACDGTGNVPREIDRRNVLGPTSLPIIGREIDTVSHDEIIALCRKLTEHVSAQGHLPANLTIPVGRVGAAQLLMLAARSYLAVARYEKFERLRVFETRLRYPEAAFKLDTHIRRSIGEHWSTDTDFSCDTIAEHMRLQRWTIKPAWLRPPRGRPCNEGRILL